MARHPGNIEDFHELHRNLESPCQDAPKGQNIFCRFRTIQRYQHPSVHLLLLVSCFRQELSPARQLKSILTLTSLALASSVLSNLTSKMPFLKLTLTFSL